MRREQNEIKSINEICQILDKCSVCRLAINNNGYPYVVPMNFGYKKGKEKLFLFFHGANAGTKKALIEKDGRVGFEMDIHGNVEIREIACNSYMEYESVCGTGNAEIIEGNKKREYLESIMNHYTDVPYEMLDKMIESVMVIKVEVVQITGKFYKAKEK